MLILGAELNSLALSLIDQSTVLLLPKRPLGEYIVSNPSQLETISSFPLILNNIHHHDKATIGPCSQSNYIFNTTEFYMYYMQIVVVINSLRQSLICDHLCWSYEIQMYLVPRTAFIDNTTESSKCDECNTVQLVQH